MIPEGQLSEPEKFFLTNFVIENKPRKILESGTWKGGGSTLSLVKGLHHNQKGILDTYEEHDSFYFIAKNFYDKSEYKPYINLHLESFLNGIQKLPDNYYNDLDLIFLDGGDELPNGLHKLSIDEYLNDYNVSENVQSFKYISQKIKSGSYMILHDWTIKEGRGNFIQRYLKENNFEDFKLLKIIEGSTGMAVLYKK